MKHVYSLVLLWSFYLFTSIDPGLKNYFLLYKNWTSLTDYKYLPVTFFIWQSLIFSSSFIEIWLVHITVQVQGIQHNCLTYIYYEIATVFNYHLSSYIDKTSQRDKVLPYDEKEVLGFTLLTFICITQQCKLLSS